MINEKTTDSKLGALSLDHRSIGEEIINELNKLSQKLYDEQCRTRPTVLTTHISDEDWERLKELFRIYCGGDDV